MRRHYIMGSRDLAGSSKLLHLGMEKNCEECGAGILLHPSAAEQAKRFHMLDTRLVFICEPCMLATPMPERGIGVQEVSSGIGAQLVEEP